ncbi:MAG: hypothetical protein LBO03_09780 [Acidaminococcales bacterium]|nr:hypothetical protein [Acidaminococcales bacterium]
MTLIIIAIYFTLYSPIKSETVAYAYVPLDRRVYIDEAGYIDVPSALMELATETNWHAPIREILGLPSANVLRIVQKGTQKFARIIIGVTKGTYGDFHGLYDDYYISEAELAELEQAIKETIGNMTTPFVTLRLVEVYPAKRGKVNNMQVIASYIVAQNVVAGNTNRPYILNWVYCFENKDRMIFLFIMYRDTEKDIWEPVMRDVLKSFRITNVIN